MEEIKTKIQIPKQTTLKSKTIAFIVFICIINMVIFTSTNSFVGIKLFKKTSDFYMDGTDFNGAVNLFGGFVEMVFTAIIAVIIFVINLAIILSVTIIFNKIYFKSIPAEKEKFNKYLKIIIWGFSIVGIISIILLNINSNIIKIFIGIIFCYLPLPILIHVLTLSKAKKVYKIYESIDMQG